MSSAKKLDHSQDISSEMEAQNKEKESAPMVLENRRILIVEDEIDIADAYTDILGQKAENVSPIRRSSRSAAKTQESPGAGTKSPGYEVTVAPDAEMALAHVKKALKDNKPFALGFFDVLLGKGKDGVELFKEIHDIDPNMIGVFVTAYNDRSVDSINEYLGEDVANQWDYLNKPFTEGEILQKARNSTGVWNLRKEKRESENELAEANRRLMDSERKSSVAAVARGVGHEFGNILVQIMGRAELSMNGNEDEMREALQTILKAGETASAILERFKSLEKSPEAKVIKDWIEINAPIDEALQLMSHQLKVKEIKVHKLKKDSAHIFGSHTSLVQVFVNLIINALHAMEGAGQIDINIHQYDDLVELRFRDYGPGISDEILPKVTEAFFTTKGSLGTGLGLAICREIIEIEHRGEFIVQNHPAKGAEIIMKLPLDDDNGDRAPQAQAGGESSPKGGLDE